MSNENSNLRVGSAGAGLFVGGTEILGGGVANLLKEITIAPDFVGTHEGVSVKILIVNLSDNEGIILYRGDSQTHIPKQHIEWYSVDGNKENFSLYNGGDKRVRGLELMYVGQAMITSFSDYYADNGEFIVENKGDIIGTNDLTFAIIIFNAI